MLYKPVSIPFIKLHPAQPEPRTTTLGLSVFLVGPSPEAGGAAASPVVVKWWMCCRENRVGVNLVVARCLDAVVKRVRVLNQYIAGVSEYEVDRMIAC
ncbi:hypothetical protein Hanom_Chr01g00015191 [Helianthus anomalus]